MKKKKKDHSIARIYANIGRDNPEKNCVCVCVEMIEDVSGVYFVVSDYEVTGVWRKMNNGKDTPVTGRGAP
jgi:hypothetical protein